MDEPKLVGGTKIEEDSGLVEADIDVSELVEEPKIVGVVSCSLIVGNPPTVDGIEGSQFIVSPNVVSDVEDSQLVIRSPSVRLDDSELVGGSSVFHDPTKNPSEEVVDVEEETTEITEDTKRCGRKRKRGRVAAKAPARAIPRKRIEEDVCFICFDGGDLVVCDHRGCPKAYHPVCVDREESFFRSKGHWDCGLHLCSICEKISRYMCYTCTYSLCKSCIRGSDFCCVRGNKGLCQKCMETALLIENNEAAHIDFVDKNCWEYYFRDYWIDLKGKLSLTLEELTQARNPSRRSGNVALKEEFIVEYNVNKDQGSNVNSGSEHIQISCPKRRKAKRKSKTSIKEEVSSSTAIVAGTHNVSMTGHTKWASKKLLEFVAHMKNGDISILSQFEVQALLLDYIKQNGLRDPHRKSQIVCDPRLQGLFGAIHVGHFEMLKLLELHFLKTENTQTDDQEGNADKEATQLDVVEGSGGASTEAGINKRRETRMKAERSLKTNNDDYAAIDVHNINLIYLKRNLIEYLLEDMDTFKNMVIGSFVRIRITSEGQKKDMYTLVQVIGIDKAKEPYETGKRKTDILLEILNFNKSEVETVDRVSNEDFSEDECNLLRQSIKCGSISRLTVGKIQEKAMVIQAARVNQCLEAEKLRLGHLRDRASEKGQRKEVKEYVKKLQRLNRPEEQLHRLQEIPEIHSDPKMDPSYESEHEEPEPDDQTQLDNNIQPRDAGYESEHEEPEPDDQTQDNDIQPKDAGYESEHEEPEPDDQTQEYVKKVHCLKRPEERLHRLQEIPEIHSDPKMDPSYESEHEEPEADDKRQDKDSQPGDAGFNQKVTGPISPGKGGSSVSGTWCESRKNSNTTWDSSCYEKSRSQGQPSGSGSDSWNGIAVLKSEPSSQTTTTSLSTGATKSSTVSEAEKIWHYIDPSGKIQGPFSTLQFQKWSTTGFFPSDLRIWRATEKQEDSIRLVDALDGKFQKEKIKPAETQNGNPHGANPVAVNNSSMGIHGFVQSTSAPPNPSISNGNSSGNGYDKTHSAHQIPNTEDHRHGILTSQGSPSPWQQEVHAKNLTAPAQVGNFPNSSFSVSNSLEQPFSSWSLTPDTQSVNPTPNMQPSLVPPSSSILPPPSEQLPHVAVVPDIQSVPMLACQYKQQPLVTATQSWGRPQGNANMGWGQPAANMCSQPKSNGNRYSGYHDRGGFCGGGFRGSGDSAHGGGRQSWNRQPSFRGGERGQPPFRIPHRERRICKFYDRGFCRNGADCNFFHPS